MGGEFGLRGNQDTDREREGRTTLYTTTLFNGSSTSQEIGWSCQVEVEHTWSWWSSSALAVQEFSDSRPRLLVPQTSGGIGMRCPRWLPSEDVTVAIVAI